MATDDSSGGGGGWPPSETDAQVGTLVNASEELTQLSSRVGVSGENLLGSISTGAMSFSDAISPAISSQGQAAVNACQQVVGEALVGASVTAAFSEDVGDYLSKIATLQARWSPWANGGAGTASALRLDEEALEAQREAIRGQIQKEANDAYSDLEDAADDRGSQLAAGATRENVRNLVGEGSMSWWAAFELFGYGYAGEPSDSVINEAAERVALLINSHGIVAGDFDMSSVERANRIMEILGLTDKYNLFATRLMEELGPNQLGDHPDAIARYAAILDDSDATTTAMDLYKNLGLALASATDTSNEHHVDHAWVQEFMDYGATDATGGYGYQKLAPLLLHGEYAGEFIVPVTNHMIGMDRDGADWGMVHSEGNPLFEGTPFAFNPVNAALDAVDRNPEAATMLFSGYQGDYDYTGLQLDPPDPLTYLLDNAANAPTEEGGVWTDISADLAGNAMVAAVTGVPSHVAGGGTEIDPPTAEMADILARMVEHTGNDPSRWMPNGAATDMVEDFGVITHYYMDDFYHHFVNAEYSDNETFNNLMPGLFGAEVDFSGEKGPNQWFQILGSQKATALQATTDAEAYGRYALDTVLANGGNEAQAGQAVYPIGGISAHVANGQIEAHDSEKIKEQDRNNLFVDQGKKVIDKAVGLTPWAKHPVGGKVNGFVTDSIATFLKSDVSDELFQHEGEFHREMRDSLMSDWWHELLDEHYDDMSDTERENWDSEIRSELHDGFTTNVNQRADQHGNQSMDESEDGSEKKEKTTADKIVEAVLPEWLRKPS